MVGDEALTVRLQTAATWAGAWLYETALPLWARAGVADVGFHDRLDALACPAGEFLRFRVQARQTFVFAEAGRVGWPGPWREAARHGGHFLLRCTDEGRRLAPPLYRLDGRRLHARPLDLYDQAFALLGFAAAFTALRDPVFETAAERLIERMRAGLGRADGGFNEDASASAPLRSNPHMHLYEAALTWVEATGKPRWRSMADEIGALARRRFIDAEGGRLLEHFQRDWSPASGEAGLVTEPGHQFEWAWLFVRHVGLGGDPDQTIAFQLADLARRTGVDRARGVMINEQWLDGRPKDRAARLWPQTERLKAALALAQVAPASERDVWLREAADAFEGLRKFLDNPGPGLWRDVMAEDGSFDREPTSASSFYHIVGALTALTAHAREAP